MKYVIYDIKSLISRKIWYNNLVFQDKGNISPLKNPSVTRDFSLLILAFPLHNSLIDTRYFYPYQAMLPVGKFQDKLLHKKKWLGDISPCSFWKQGASKLYIFLRKINFTKIHHSDHKICSHFSLQEAIAYKYLVFLSFRAEMISEVEKSFSQKTPLSSVYYFNCSSQ